MEGTIPQAEKASGLATTALILSIVGILCCGVASIIGIILGVIELGKINKGESSEKGRGYAKAAIIIGIATLAIGILLNIILITTGTFTFYSY